MLILVTFENITSVHFLNDVVETAIVPICYDCFALRLELGEVVDDLTAEEGGTIFKGWLVNNDIGTLGLDALHDALDGALAEVVGVALHREAIDTDGDRLLAAIVLVISAVSVPTGLAKDLVGNKVLTGAIALDNGGHHVLGHVGISGQELFGVLGEAVAAIAKTWVVVVGADTGVETDARDNGLAVETLDFGIGVEFVEIRDS